MKSQIQNRRKNHFIKKKFQMVFILKFCTIVILGSFISIGLIYAFSKGTTTAAFENSRLVIKSTADFILPAVLMISAVVVLCVGGATIFVTLFASHKIAGPLFRMEKDIEDVANGNLNKTFHLREQDEIKALSASLDKMNTSLKEKINNIKNALSALEESLKKESSDTISSETDSRLNELKSRLDVFKT